MTEHYHGTPISPRAVLEQLAGRRFCVSFAAPRDVEWALEHGAGLMLDNGAFSYWRTGRETDWPAYYEWAAGLIGASPASVWAVIPDVIDGGELENDRLIAEWPLGKLHGAPVWHLHETLGRLEQLAHDWPRVCLGSSGQFATVGDAAWRRRMGEAMDALCGAGGRPPCALHMLRGMRFAGGPYPFASVDSTDVARNHNRGGLELLERQERAKAMCDRWERMHAPETWNTTQLELERAAA